MNDQMEFRSPYPYFGGKRRIAHAVWNRFGDVQNYVEPFFGSGAVLLARPHTPKIETINDLDAMVANFWRALTFAPEAVADFADYPINEADLHARHLWLVNQSEFRERMKTDPDYYDPKIAGWWVWGICAWLASGWCHHEAISKQTGLMGRSIPAMGGGRGVHSSRVLDAPGGIQSYFVALAKRLRRVRVVCGDWSRVLTPAVLGNGQTAVLLDPPYFEGLSDVLYVHSDANISARVREWAIENGENPNLRIALCGYSGEHTLPASWKEVAWKASGGFGGQREDGSNLNAERERIWFSPACLDVSDTLFEDYDDDEMTA